MSKYRIVTDNGAGYEAQYAGDDGWHAIPSFGTAINSNYDLDVARELCRKHSRGETDPISPPAGTIIEEFDL